MDIHELAKILYDAGYEHRQVRSIWGYAWSEQSMPRSGRKRVPWEKKALDEIGVDIGEIEFYDNFDGNLNNYL